MTLDRPDPSAMVKNFSSNAIRGDSTKLSTLSNSPRSYTPKEEGNSPNFDGYVVIGAGLPRTGTLSMKTALEKLLNGPCYHMRQVLDGGVEEIDHWEKVLNGKISREEWKLFLEGRGFRSGVDYPISHHFE